MSNSLRSLAGHGSAKPLLPVFFIASFLFVGCGGEKLPPDLPKLYPTKVVVIQDGKPLEGANVVLLPKDPDNRWGAAGQTDSSGVVEFYTEGRYRGVPEGEYQLTVSKVYTEPGQYIGQTRPDEIDRQTWDRLIAEEGRKLNSYRLVDPIYDSRKTSPLELSVGPKQPKDQKIDVGKAFNELIPFNR